MKNWGYVECDHTNCEQCSSFSGYLNSLSEMLTVSGIKSKVVEGKLIVLLDVSHVGNFDWYEIEPSSIVVRDLIRRHIGEIS